MGESIPAKRHGKCRMCRKENTVLTKHHEYLLDRKKGKIFTKNIIKGEPIPVFNYGKMKRDFTYINDIVLGTRSAMKKNYACEIFNLGNNKVKSLMDMITIIETNLGKKADIDFQSIKAGDVVESFADINKSIEKLDYNPKIDIEQGIPKFIDWYKYYISI